ncbi:MAG: hypothetical protein JWN44_2324 [Myxococcales bacterium]|nr:hypothetical protein [Myxococcales bacterium]
MFARRVVALLLLSSGVARAQAADGGVPDGGVADGGVAGGGVAGGGVAERAVADGTGRSAHAGSPIAQALDEFDFGDYESVVTRLRPIVDALELAPRDLPQKTDRMEALRIYGIACTLTDRKTAAEGAFLLLLREEPSTRLDPTLVRPEAVAFFDQVRARHRDELLAAYRKTRPRYYWALDLIPLAGQLQNRQWRKAVIFGSVELVLLAANITTGAVLDARKGDHRDFMPEGPTGPDYRGMVPAMRGVNIASFVALLVVTGAGIIDAFVVGKRRVERERQVEARLGL